MNRLIGLVGGAAVAVMMAGAANAQTPSRTTTTATTHPSTTATPSGVAPVTAYDDPPQAWMHEQLAARRAYLHPMRWTSLGLSLLEAMSLGMPVVALATTEAVMAVPPTAGVLSTRVEELLAVTRGLLEDPDSARRLGAGARLAATERYGLDRFLADWDRLLEEELCG